MPLVMRPRAAWSWSDIGGLSAVGCRLSARKFRSSSLAESRKLIANSSLFDRAAELLFDAGHFGLDAALGAFADVDLRGAGDAARRLGHVLDAAAHEVEPEIASSRAGMPLPGGYWFTRMISRI